MSAATLGLTAEQYAAGHIRRAIDSACVPDLQAIADDSALTLREVEAIRDRILSGKRDTRDLGRPRGVVPPRPVPVPSAPQAAAPAPVESVDVLIDASIAHKSHRVRRAAAKAHTARLALASRVDELRAAIDAAGEDARRRARIAKLEAELAALRGNKPKRGPVDPGTMPHPCHLCGRRFSRPQGLSRHLHQTHGEAK